MTSEPQKPRPGEAVDARGGPVVDPTRNVLDLVEAANKRQDDLRNETNRLFDTEVRHLKEMSALRAAHASEMRAAEADRLNSIRQVDVTAVKTEADRALAAIQTLAATTTANAENLRNALTATAATIAKQTSDTVSQLIERIAALEKSSYEGVGKQRIADPAMDDLVREVKSLRESRATVTGKSEGIGTSWSVLIAAVALIGAVLAIGTTVFQGSKTPSPQIVYVPPPTALPAK